MAQPSSLQSLGGPLGSQRFEFRGGDVFVGADPDCAVRINATGVAGRHARITISITGAMIYALDGVVGVNDDRVTGDSFLRNGDFVWIGEPGGEESMMLQFTLGDVEEAAPIETPATDASPAPPDVTALPAEVVEEVVVEEPAAPLVEEPVVEQFVEPPALLMEEPVAQKEPAPQQAENLAPEPMAAAPALLQAPAETPAAFGDLEPVPEVEPILEEAATLPLPAQAAPVVPPAPWQMPAVPTPEPAAPAADYAMAWESAPPKPAEATPAPPPVEGGEATVLLPAPPAPAPVAKRPAVSPTAPKVKIRTVEQDAALRKPPPPPPPARTTSSTPMVVGGLGVAAVVAVVGYFLLASPAQTPAPKPTPVPVAVNTPPPATPEPTVEATPAPPPVAVETPQVAPPAKATPPPRATPAPRATPTPRPTPTPKVVATPVPAPTRQAAPAPMPPPVAAPVSQIPRLLEDERAAAAAKDYARAAQILGQILGLEPGNAEATTRKADIDARLISTNRKFSVGPTTVIGGKGARGPTGFDVGGAVVQTDFVAQIKCSITPASMERGAAYAIRCSILNVGTKSFKIENVTVNELVDGAKTAGTAMAPRQDIGPQTEVAILDKAGTWSAKTQWSVEVIAKTNKDESFRAVYIWR